MIHDEERLRQTLGQPELAWLVERIRRRLERDRTLSGATATLHRPSAAQRRAIDRFIGRRPTSGAVLKVRLDRITEVLRHGEICDKLEEAVEVLGGPIISRRAVKEREHRAWSAIDQQVQAAAQQHPALNIWWSQLLDDGYLKRASGSDPTQARRLVEQVLRVVAQLPCSGVPLPELAAKTLGNSHALDPGYLGTLALRAAAAIGGLTDESPREGRRQVWASVGVLCDELSFPALVLNLRSCGTGLTSRVLNAYAEQSEPARLSIRQLLCHPPDFSSLAGQPIYVCENVAIMATAAQRLAHRCAPLVCTEGNPRTAVHLLLRKLAQAGADLRVRADFDCVGIQIVNNAVATLSASPWRMSVEDYSSVRGGAPLKGNPQQPVWEPALRDAMVERGQVVHEERLIERLLDDLRTR